MENLLSLSIQKLFKSANRLEKDPDTYRTAPADSRTLKIAVLGSFSIQHFVKLLRLFLDRAGIIADIYEGEYGGINMDSLDNSSPLFTFKPEIVILLMRHTDFRLEASSDLTKAKEYFQNIWTHIGAIPGVTIIESNIAIPIERPLGTLESSYSESGLSLFRELNLCLTKEHPDNVKILDLEYLSAYYGKERWFDDAAYYLTKQGFSMDYLGIVANEATKMILPLLGRIKKCLVLDLDNTVWGGVVADEGPLGIGIDPNDPVGEAYLAFQRYVLSLKKRGVLLAVNSKNDEEIAKEPFLKNPNMVLKLSDISCFVANWSDKASNMAYIAKRLNIGIDSLVFFDDSPAERELIKNFCPEVYVVNVPSDPENYVRELDSLSLFDWSEITEEDRKRADSYAENEMREALKSSFVDYRSYLLALEMKSHAGRLRHEDLGRFTQLTNKSNQFNLRTCRYTEAELRSFMDNESYRLISVNLADKFTEYGIISCIIIKKGIPEGLSKEEGFYDTDCFIENWCMSCRVLKRTVEEYAFLEVIRQARELGAKRLIGEYVRTRKNGMVEGLFARLGFIALNNDNRLLYAYDLSKEPVQDILIKEL